MTFKHYYKGAKIGTGNIAFRDFAPVPTLATPTNVAVSDTTLSWDEVENATSYDIYADGTLIGNTDGGGAVVTPYSFTVTNQGTKQLTSWSVDNYQPVNLTCDKTFPLAVGDTATFTFDDFSTNSSGKKVGFQMSFEGYNYWVNDGSTYDGLLVLYTLSSTRINVAAAPGYEISSDVPHSGWVNLKGYDD